MADTLCIFILIIVMWMAGMIGKEDPFVMNCNCKCKMEEKKVVEKVEIDEQQIKTSSEEKSDQTTGLRSR